MGSGPHNSKVLGGPVLDKRFQVFVSSTYEDLRVERQEVMQALLELDCMPSGMELFPAANNDQWTLIKKVIDDCDYYLVIVGGRYGTTDPNGKSYTQMEYEYALSTGKPAIAFLHENPGSISSAKTEKTEAGKAKLEEFRQLAQKKAVKYWSTAHELGSVVSRSIVKLIKSDPATGWVRADELVEGAAAQELLRLRKKIEDLQAQLQQSTKQAPQGTERLAQGDEEYELSFETSFNDEDEEPVVLDLKMTWNEIVKVLAPLMIDKSTSSELSRALVRHCRQALLDEVDEMTGGEVENAEFKVSAQSLQVVIVQLRALGIIAKDERPRSVKDTKTYWSLTLYGDTIMTRLTAIPTALLPDAVDSVIASHAAREPLARTDKQKND